MASITSREVRLASRTPGIPIPANFEIATSEAPEPRPGEAQVRNLWMSVDPSMRSRIRDPKGFQIGAPLAGAAIGEVVASGARDLKPGDLVSSQYGWREAFTAPGGDLQKLPLSNTAPPQAYLGVLGSPGMTAYAGMLGIGDPQAGETVFVTAAGGLVGSVACQIAKIKGVAVIASAGGDEKLAWLKSRGVDHIVNYKKGDILANVRAAAPNGIDLFFDNVGGEQLEVAIELARMNARLVICGVISAYNDVAPPGPRNMLQVLVKQLTIRGFHVTAFQHMRQQFLADMSQWISDGRMQWQETIETGLDRAPQAFINLFSGVNAGKMLVKLA